jgi:hypothetical protein
MKKFKYPVLIFGLPLLLIIINYFIINPFLNKKSDCSSLASACTISESVNNKHYGYPLPFRNVINIDNANEWTSWYYHIIIVDYLFYTLFVFIALKIYCKSSKTGT